MAYDFVEVENDFIKCSCSSYELAREKATHLKILINTIKSHEIAENEDEGSLRTISN